MRIEQSEWVGTALPDKFARVLGEITEQRWLALARALIVAGQPAAENPRGACVLTGSGQRPVIARLVMEAGLADQPLPI